MLKLLLSKSLLQAVGSVVAWITSRPIVSSLSSITSSPRRRGSILPPGQLIHTITFISTWIPACAGMTIICIPCLSYGMTEIERQLQKRDQEIEKTARDFESTMISRSLKSMYEGIKTDPIAGGGSAEGIYRELLVEEYAKMISKGDGFKLVNYISRDIKRGDTQYKNLMRAQNEERAKAGSK